ncbi:hypothetical protein XM38_028220 [Halomicronema hongdechloris C2206]|uniref:Coenzyme Q-binding protein COQ10 START domain-containing protein n=1 Tax=Halomicronema hongdechloris C2206 TaxID=1641165 RepID=A0A1Z3HNH9_9CYAN|nr:SRPBCC family protein [Halomicronema hongdechloris]ASC71868.1 hypothetical protein XM38_028220 [Halomicronema hongdechloris C2206]
MVLALERPPHLLVDVPHPSDHCLQALLRGQIVVDTYGYTEAGKAVTAQMYVPLMRSHLWEQLTHYSRWTQYFPNIVHSELLASHHRGSQGCRRLYQVGRKAFLMMNAQVEIYLNVFETLHRRIQFRFERGSFTDFAADLTLQDCQGGTLLTYSVQATPLIPVPGFLVEQAMRHDLPGNMEQMRRVLCRSC